MPARDIYHEAGKNALINDGWIVTHDPYRMSVGQRTVYVDLGASSVLAAERGDRRIAVEIKTFQGSSEVADLEQALGQYVLYRSLLRRTDPERQLYLAVPQKALVGIFQEPIALPVLDRPARLRSHPRGGRRMEELARFRQVIRELLHEYAQHKPAVGEVEAEIIIDETQDHYELIVSGWSGPYRTHGSVPHFDIRGGRIWIQGDGTEEGIANRLLEADIPREKIVLAFKPPEMRPHTGFAVA